MSPHVIDSLKVLAVALAVLFGAPRLIRALRGPSAPSSSADETPPAPPAAGGEEPAELGSARARLAAHRRTAYLPVTDAGDGAPNASKFSGVPFIPAGEGWPACGNCGRPMQLFVQLAADELPGEARERIGAGHLLQFFYCTSDRPCCESDCDAYAPHARSTLLRLVRADGVEGGTSAATMPEGMYPPLRITRWREVDDYPGWEEQEDLGIELSDPESEALGDLFPREGEKLLGWPYWVQGVEYPVCRICATPMELLFQVDSERNLPYMFGDAGVGHVTQCPAHRTELAFGWACH